MEYVCLKMSMRWFIYLLCIVFTVNSQLIHSMMALQKKQQEIAQQQLKHARVKTPGSLAQFFDANKAMVQKYAQAIFKRQQSAYESNVDSYTAHYIQAQTAWSELVNKAAEVGIIVLSKTDPDFFARYEEQKKALYDADIMYRFANQLDVAFITRESFTQCDKGMEAIFKKQEKDRSRMVAALKGDEVKQKLFFLDVEKFAQNLREALIRKAIASGIDLTAPQTEKNNPEETKGDSSKTTKTFQALEGITPEKILALTKEGLITLFGLPDSFNVIYVKNKDDLAKAIAAAIDRKLDLQRAIDEQKDTIKAIYKKLSTLLHPDKNPGNEEAATKAFSKIDKFYKDLMQEAVEVYEKAEKFQNLVEHDY